MRKSIIVAMTLAEHVIGKDNRLPWYLPADLARFKALTMGHTIIMGRRTYQSIGKALPGRTNIVISGELGKEFVATGGCLLARSFEDALSLVPEKEGEVFFIGGVSVFEKALPVADRVYLTYVLERVPGDIFFPSFDHTTWLEIEREEHPSDMRNRHGMLFLTLDRRP